MNKLTEIIGIATISTGLIFAPGCIKKETQEEKTKTTLPQVELKESETIECTVVKIETFDVDYEWQFGIAETLYKAKQSKQ